MRLLPALTTAALLAVTSALAPPAAAAAPRATAVFSTGKQVVAAMALAGDGRVFYVGPASNAVFVWSPTTRKVTTFATVPGATGGFGVVLSPTFARDHLLYAYVAVAGHERLVRWTAQGSHGTAFRVLRDVGPAGTDHTGGAMSFSRNGKNLFLVVGDGGDPASSQDLSVDHGKVLRLTPTGAPAPGNPGYPDPAVWAYGIRNSIGLAVDPRTQHVWETENGPECNDEVNALSGGRNYGWGPHEVCDGTTAGTNQDGAAPQLPAEVIPAVVAPVGATFCAGCGLPGAEGALVYGRFLSHDLRRVSLSADRLSVVSDRLLWQGTSSPTAVQSSPVDSSIWFADLSHTVRRLR